MTDPENVKELKKLCLNTIIPKDITSIYYYKNSLWFAEYRQIQNMDKKSSYTLYIADRKSQDSFEMRFTFSLAYENQFVRSFKAFSFKDDETLYEGMIIHYNDSQNQTSGPVEIIFPGFLRRTISNNASFVLCNQLSYNEFANKQCLDPQDLRIAIVSDNTITIYSFLSYQLVLMKKITVKSTIKAADMASDFIVFADESNLYRLNFLDENNQVEDLATDILPKTQIKTISDDRILVFNKNIYTLVFNDNDKEQIERGSSHPEFLKPIEDIKFVYGSEAYLYFVYPDKIIGYQYGSTESQTFKINDARLLCKVDQDLFVKTSNVFYRVGSIPSAQKLNEYIISGKIEEVYKAFEKLPIELCSGALSELFELLWKEKRFDAALELTTKFAWYDFPCGLFKFFNDIQCDQFVQLLYRLRKGIREHYTILEFNSENKSLYEKLQKSVKLMFDTYNKKNAAEYIDLISIVLLELYVINQETRELNNFLLENQNKKNINSIMSEIIRYVEAGLNTNKPFGPSYAVLKTRCGELKPALEIWYNMYNRKQLKFFLTEMSYTLQECTDSITHDELLSKYLEWIYPHSQEAAINSILSTKHNPNTVIKFLSDHKREKEKILYYDFCIHQPDFIPRENMIKECLNEYIDILVNVDKPGFKLDRLDFTHSKRIDKLQGKELVQAVKVELKNKIIYVLESFAPIVGHTIISAIIDKYQNQINDKELILSMYRVNGKYKEGIAIIQSKYGDPINDMAAFDQEVKQFLITSPDPSEAFKEFFNLLTPEKVFSDHINFILDNILYLDPISTINFIPSNMKLTKTIVDLINSLYNILLQRNSFLDLEISTTKSLEVDTDYRLSREESLYCTIDSDTLCEKCGQPIGKKQFFMAPPDQNSESSKQKVYHTHCKPEELT